VAYGYTSMNISVKLFVNNECRRFMFNGGTFADLKEQSTKVANLATVNGVILQYSDDEGDLVTFSSDAELQYAVSLLKTEPRVLRIYLSLPSSANKLTAVDTPMTDVQKPPENIGIPQQQIAWGRGGGRGGRGSWRREDHAGGFHHHPIGGRFGYARQDQYFEKPHKIRNRDLDARFVAHVTHDDGTEVLAGAPFNKTWRFRNNGTVRWPEGTVLLRVDRANELAAPASTLLPSLPEPNDEVEVTVPLKSPVTPGLYNSYFKLCSPGGRKFGQRMRCQILAVSEDRTKIWDQLTSMGLITPETDRVGIARLIVQEQGDISRIVRAIVDKNNHRQ